MSTIGNKIIVHVGINSKIGINEKSNATSMNINNAIEKVDTTGKNSLLIFTDVIIGKLVPKIVTLARVPLIKRWYNIIPDIKYIAKSALESLILVNTTCNKMNIKSGSKAAQTKPK